MSLKILYVTATAIEAEALKSSGILNPADGFASGKFDISVLIAGVGCMSTVWNMNKWLSLNGKPDLAINAGIAGTFSGKLKTGDVVMPALDCFADSGLEDRDEFITLFDAGLADPEEFPYRGGFLHADEQYITRLRHIAQPVRAITRNTATGSEITREKIVKKFNPDIETMEGASFFYICIREGIPFCAIRAISNIVEPRNRKNWNIPLAIEQLTRTFDDILVTLR